jgi:hypothetical protein
MMVAGCDLILQENRPTHICELQLPDTRFEITHVNPSTGLLHFADHPSKALNDRANRNPRVQRVGTNGRLLRRDFDSPYVAPEAICAASDARNYRRVEHGRMINLEGNLLDRTVVAITGASSGIGAAFARRLAAEHDLLLIARRKDRLEGLAAELSTRYQTRVDTLAADLTVESDLALVAERIRRQKGLALLVNNAGFGTRGRFWEAPLSGQEQMHRLHVMATVKLTHAALRNLVRNGIP